VSTPPQGGSLALPVTDPELEERLRSRLDEVEKALYAHVQSRFPFVTEAASHLLDAGGKRFRPASGSGRCWCCWPPRPATTPVSTTW